jgi:hypothetical protein
MLALVRIDRRMLAGAPRKNLHRLSKFLKLEVPCSCAVCLVEAIIRKLDRDELASSREAGPHP